MPSRTLWHTAKQHQANCAEVSHCQLHTQMDGVIPTEQVNGLQGRKSQHLERTFTRKRGSGSGKLVVNDIRLPQARATGPIHAQSHRGWRTVCGKHTHTLVLLGAATSTTTEAHPSTTSTTNKVGRNHPGQTRLLRLNNKREATSGTHPTAEATAPTWNGRKSATP